MYSWIFDFLYDTVKLTDNWIANSIITPSIYAVLHVLTYSSVGDLYRSKFISGSLEGKIAYRVIMLINIFITIGILWLSKGVIWLNSFVQTFTLLNWILIVGVFVLVIGLVISIKVIVNRRQEGEMI